jgi:pyruvate-formate lyase-activating enzyme
MNATIAKTTVLCDCCRASHPATVERDGNRVVGRVFCPQQSGRTVTLSSNAALYTTLRERSSCHQPLADGERPRLLNLLPVTQHCNLRCPVCYADAGPQNAPSFLPVDEAVRRMTDAKRRGARMVSLTGGEATLHPELLTLVQRARALRLRVQLVTNGLRFTEEPGLARALKRAGLFRVSLQFDTLNPQTLRLLRGTDDVEAKTRAARNIVAAGLRLGTITTVTRHNLPELGDIISFGLSLAPAITTITLQAAAPVGRFDLGLDATVDKEQILAAVLAAKSLPGVSLDDVWPLPRFAPWGLMLHPDCGVNLIVLTNGNRLHWLRECVDVPALHRRLGASDGNRSWMARNLRPLWHLLGATRAGQRGRLSAHLTGFVTGRGRRSIVIIGVGGFCHRGFLDKARLAGCATDELTATGGVSPCLVYSGVSS